MQLTEAEGAFRIQKRELKLRPLAPERRASQRTHSCLLSRILPLEDSLGVAEECRSGIEPHDAPRGAQADPEYRRRAAASQRQGNALALRGPTGQSPSGVTSAAGIETTQAPSHSEPAQRDVVPTLPCSASQMVTGKQPSSQNPSSWARAASSLWARSPARTRPSRLPLKRATVPMPSMSVFSAPTPVATTSSKPSWSVDPEGRSDSAYAATTYGNCQEKTRADPDHSSHGEASPLGRLGARPSPFYTGAEGATTQSRTLNAEVSAGMSRNP